MELESALKKRKLKKCESNNQYALSPVSMYTTNKAISEGEKRDEKGLKTSREEGRGKERGEGRVQQRERESVREW